MLKALIFAYFETKIAYFETPVCSFDRKKTPRASFLRSPGELLLRLNTA